MISSIQNKGDLPTVFRKKLPPNLERIRNTPMTTDDPDYPIHLYLKENDIRVEEKGSDIINFLRGKGILVTGGTGFLGKLLVEKLIRCCKDIEKVYIIIRAKKGKDPEIRLKEYLDNWVFVKLSEIYPKFRDKVVGVSGDFELPGLGLTEESRKLLIDKVNIIYHVAATVRFDEQLKKAVRINIKGTQEMIQLAKDCKKLDVFLHMSTAYSNCHKKEIGEKFYDPIMIPEDLIRVTDILDKDVIDRITPGLLGELPNTYAFTKQITEDLVRREAIGFPACVHRPSIVVASSKEPIRSWIDNIFGPAGLIEGAAVGLLHAMVGNSNCLCDMVPADFVINSCIASSYKTAKDGLNDRVQVFNYTTSQENPLHWGEVQTYTQTQGWKVGSTLILWKAFFRFIKSIRLYYIINYFFHIIPAHILDFAAVKVGQPPRLVKAYGKINKFVNVMSHFTSNEWLFDNSNTMNLWNSLNENDKKIFNFDMKSLDWQDYFDTYLVAMRELIAFEFLDNLEYGRKYMKRMVMLHNSIVTIVGLGFVYFLYKTYYCIY